MAALLLIGALFAARRERFGVAMAAPLATAGAGLVASLVAGGWGWFATRLLLVALVVWGRRFYVSR